MTTAFRAQIREVVSLSGQSTAVTEDTVYQQGSAAILPYLDQMVESLLLPGSGMRGMEHLYELYTKAAAGKSCLLCLEHYSNLDLSLFSYLLRRDSERGKAAAGAVVAIAGIKLNEENPVVAAFSSAYSRLVIYPSRSLMEFDAVKDRPEIIRSNAINRAAMKALMEIKVSGKLILVFPSGTRYRPWDPASKRGVREIDSYIKAFDYLCPVAINGEVLHVHQGDMMDDPVSKDLVLLTAGPVRSCAAFRDQCRADAEAAGTADKKQAVADALMGLLEAMHLQAEGERQKLLKG